MQISVTQGYFFQFFIKTTNIKKILEMVPSQDTAQ